MILVSDRLHRIYKSEHARMVATLTRMSGSLDLAEESVQAAYEKALRTWPVSGVPDRPEAWMFVSAKRHALDRLRKQKTVSTKEQELTAYLEAHADDAPQTFPDDRLGLMCMCCHPAIHPQSQVALTLRTVAGLTTEEIARAFWVEPTAMAQRLVRARKKIQLAGIPWGPPRPDDLPERLENIRAVIYLVFNEGYLPTGGSELTRPDLCREALHLGRVLMDVYADDPENLGLWSLMALPHARHAARTDARGKLVALDQQDRKLWDHSAIEAACVLVRRALSMSPAGQPGPYAIKAALAAVHAEAKTAEATDWTQIEALYGVLATVEPSISVALNHAVATGMARGASAGLRALDALGVEKELSRQHLYHAARAAFLADAGSTNHAIRAYDIALTHVKNEVERAHLEEKRAALLEDT